MGTTLVKHQFYHVSSELRALQKENAEPERKQETRKQELRRVGAFSQNVCTWSTLTLKSSVNTTGEKASLSCALVRMPLAINTMLLHFLSSKIDIFMFSFFSQVSLCICHTLLEVNRNCPHFFPDKKKVIK